MADLKTKKGIEIFSVGNWNDTEITSDDLDEIIRAWKENPNFKLPLKLGHSDAQRLLQQDGLPAAGWIGNLYRNGNKLLADLIDIPSKIYQLIENGAYRQVSSEVFFNITVNGKKYRKMLAGLALLGADVPGVMNLNDMLSLYGHKDYESMKLIVKNNEESTNIEIHFLNKEHTMPNTELEKLEQDLATEKANFAKAQEDLKKIQDEKEQAEKELSDLRTFKVNTEKEKQETAKQLREAQVQTFITELQAEKLSTPSMKQHLEALLGEQTENFTIKVTEKDEQKYASKQEVLKAMLVLFKQAATVNFEENSEVGKDGSDKLTEEQIVEKAEKLAEENKITFKQALRQIRAEVKSA